MSAENNSTTQLVPMGKVGRPYGLTGAVHLYPYSQDAQTLLKSKTLLIGAVTFDVTRSRRHGDSIVAQLVGVDSPEAAAKLTNKEVLVDRALFAALPDGEYYWLDLIGLTCTNGDRVFGEISEIFESGAHPILRVKQASGVDELIPFVDAIVRSVSLAERRVDVDWEGLE
ncbi:MAG: 16S rRNA processing protein RimM [Rhizobacter sp.]|nr:16S rRNA processing protein RimM [Burkholderiales bacterium]